MQLNVWNDLVKAKRRWREKKVVKPKFCISSLLTESAGVMKSKLFPNVDSSGFKYILSFFNGWYCSERHTQPDPQSCRVRSLGGRRGEPKNKQRIKKDQNKNWAVRRPIVTKRSAANWNTEKSIPPAMSQGISTSCSARPEDRARLMGTRIYIIHVKTESAETKKCWWWSPAKISIAFMKACSPKWGHMPRVEP